MAILGIITIVVFFFIIPFIFTTALPAFILPIFFLKRSKAKIKNKEFIYIFAGILVTLSILINILWEIFLYGKAYYEWDRIFMPYNLFFYESPLLDGTGSWLAKDWSQWDLYAIWVTFTTSIYIITYFSSLTVVRVTKEYTIYKAILVKSILPFIIISLIAAIIKAITLL